MPGTGPSADPTALTVSTAAVRGRMRIPERDIGLASLVLTPVPTW